MAGTMVGSAAQAERFLAALGPHEREVVDQLAEGWTNSKIAERLFLSPKTVENRVSAAYAALPPVDGADRRVQVVLLVLLARGDPSGRAQAGRSLLAGGRMR